ncbi:LVIVD repeat-containing protein [Ulvibacter antarcticus]|uniref:hypothetical protein n=1 Tax=Ulvibacter antarcticus TaxID=442714 RepID=UPI000EF9DA19|nr:hypothetical protein [Ulvibacter antarcticus]
MKKLKLLLLTAVVISLQSCCYYGGCNDDDIGDPFFNETDYTAIVMDRASFETSVELLSPRAIINSGKIYVIADLLIINEVNEGFHIFLNSDPTNPSPLNFITAPGSSDVSVKNDVLYINHAVDLIAVSYNASLAQLSVTKRIRNIFPSLLSPDGFYHFGGEDQIVVNWILTPQP